MFTLIPIEVFLFRDSSPFWSTEYNKMGGTYVLSSSFWVLLNAMVRRSLASLLRGKMSSVF